MKVEARRSFVLQPFILSMDDVDQLIHRISRLYGEDERPLRTRIRLQLDKRDVELDGVEELGRVEYIPATLRDFELTIADLKFDNSRRVHITKGASLLGESYRVTAVAGDPAWCAGAVDQISEFLAGKRVWYSRIPRLPLISYVLFMFFFITALIVVGRALGAPNATYVVGWIASFVIGIYVPDVVHRIFPVGSIQVRPEISLIKRKQAELTLFLAAVATAAAVAGLFV